MMAKEKSFTEYMRDWRKKKPIKLRAEGLPLDNLGETDGVIRLSAPDPMKKGKKRERVHTRIKRASDPRTGVINTKRARRRRKGVTVEI